MKVVTPVQMREIDSYTINKVGIPGIVLMENAAVRVTDEILKDYGSLVNKNIVLLAGKGNNGGMPLQLQGIFVIKGKYGCFYTGS